LSWSQPFRKRGQRSVLGTVSWSASHHNRGAVRRVLPWSLVRVLPVTLLTTGMLPTELTPGYYDLILIWEDGNGGTGDPHNIVRVGTQ
jgi:hypothetical protein